MLFNFLFYFEIGFEMRIDFYGLAPNFPGYHESRQQNFCVDFFNQAKNKKTNDVDEYNE